LFADSLHGGMIGDVNHIRLRRACVRC
jgi:hypothetical protein